MSITETAREFFEACETGRGNPKFVESAPEDVVAETRANLEAILDGMYELKSFSADEGRAIVTAFAVFKGTQTGPGPADPPTGKSVAADYVYAMEFDGDRIKHMTKIWNDVQSLRELGWA